MVHDGVACLVQGATGGGDGRQLAPLMISKLHDLTNHHASAMSLSLSLALSSPLSLSSSGWFSWQPPRLSLTELLRPFMVGAFVAFFHRPTRQTKHRRARVPSTREDFLGAAAAG